MSTRGGNMGQGRARASASARSILAGSQEDLTPRNFRLQNGSFPYELVPFGTVVPRMTRAVYGDDQLEKALTGYPTNGLREAARVAGLPSGGSRADLAHRIAEHTKAQEPIEETERRLQLASAGWRPRGGDGQGIHTLSMQERSDLIYGPGKAATPKPTTKPSTTKAATAKAAKAPRPGDIPRPDSQLRALLDDPTDARAAWRAFGATKESVQNALVQEPGGVLEAMARRSGFGMPKNYDALKSPGAKTRSLAKHIATKLDAELNPTPVKAPRSTTAKAATGAAKKPPAATRSPSSRTPAAARTPVVTSPRLASIRSRQAAYNREYKAAQAQGMSPLEAIQSLQARGIYYPEARAMP